ncbi:MAG: poly-gamma-glutamate hydrolase family protein, partial [Acidimicrobiales bacterium]
QDMFTTLLLGGRNRELGRHVGRHLQSGLPGYEIVDALERIPKELRGLHPENPVNRPRQGGVQLELPPRVRGLGPFWADFRAEHGDDAHPPHTEALIDALADAATTWTP